MPGFRLKNATILTMGRFLLRIVPSLYAGREEQVKRIECAAVKAYKSVKREA